MRRLFHSNIFAIIFAALTGVGGVIALALAGKNAIWARIAAVFLAAGAVFLLGIHASQAAKISRRNNHYRSRRVYFSPAGQMRDSRTARDPAHAAAIICLALSLVSLLIGGSAVYRFPPPVYGWFESRRDSKAGKVTIPEESVTEPVTDEPATVPEESAAEPEETTTEPTTAYTPVTPKATKPKATAPKSTTPPTKAPTTPPTKAPTTPPTKAPTTPPTKAPTTPPTKEPTTPPTKAPTTPPIKEPTTPPTTPAPPADD
ncbi:MAG: hypothetical protein LBT21_07345 [Oscillospiraceae bacterium]|jgi:hypothetical protein|nr:hypothetical protein [Oscillospiraceae bacterium]